MSPTQFLATLKSRWPIAAVVVSLILGATLAWSLLARKDYTATAAVLVELKADPVAVGAPSGGLASTYMTTQVDVIQSDRVAQRAIKKISQERMAELRAKWERSGDSASDFGAWLTERMARNLEVKPTRESGVMNVAFTDTDPQAAADGANAIVDAYIETRLELRVEPARQYGRIFDDRARQLRGTLEAAQSALSAYQSEKGIVASDERLDTEDARLSALSAQLVALQAVAAESSSRRSEAASDVSRVPEVLSSLAVTNLTGDIARQQSRLDELTTRLGERHPQVVEQRASIAQLRSQLDAESRRVVGGIGVNASVNQARMGELRALLQDQRTKLLRLKSQRDDAAVLIRDVENARRAYDAVAARASQAGLESQNTQPDVAVLKRARPPVLAASPKLGLNMSIAAVVGTMLALVAVMLREITDARLRSAADVTTGLQQHLLVVLPGAPRARWPARIGQVPAGVAAGSVDTAR